MNIKTAVIPVAGQGTRFLPITLTIPKAMIPIIDRPSVQYSLDEAVSAGIEHIIFVISAEQESIPRYFEKRLDLEELITKRGNLDLLSRLKIVPDAVDLSFVVQESAQGLGDAIMSAKDQLAGETFAVLLPDDLILSHKPTIAQMIAIEAEKGGIVLAIKKVPDESIENLGIVNARKIDEKVYKIIEMVEKPKLELAPSNLAIIGRYILSGTVFDAISSTPPGKYGELQLTDSINTMIANTPCHGYAFDADHFDIGIPLGMLKASIHAGLRRKDIGPDLHTWIARAIR